MNPMPDDHLLRAIAAHAAARPDSVALKYGDRVMTYGNLCATIASRAAALERHGLRPGQRAGLVMRDFIDDLVLRCAVMSLGGVAGSMDVFAKADTRAESLARYGLDWVIEDAACHSGQPRSILADDAWLARADAETADLRFDQAPDDLAMIVFSSGTTGAPIGAVQTHTAIMATARHLAAELKINPLRTLVSQWHFTPAGSATSILGLCHGGAIVFQPAIRDHRALADILIAESITSASVSPGQADGLIALARERGVAPLLPDMQALTISGAVCPPRTYEQTVALVCPRTIVIYGSGSVGAVSRLVPPDVPDKVASVGRLLPGIMVEIVDDADQPLPPGETGRIRMRSSAPPPVLIGLPRGAGGDRRVDAWSYPGDLGRMDDQGYLYILGREGDVINIDGVKVYAPDLESALAPCPGLRAIAVVGAPDAALGQVPVAFAVVDPGVTLADLETFARSRLSGIRRPHRWVLTDALPLGPSGKVLRRELLARLTDPG